MKRLFKFFLVLILFIFFLVNIGCDTRKEKFKKVNKDTTKKRTEKLNYIKIYNVDFKAVKGEKNYYLTITFYANNVSDRIIYWFKVLVNIYVGGKLTHSIIYTPNYYAEKDGIKYYHYLKPGQTGQFKIIFGENYEIKQPPTDVRILMFEVGDNIEIFNKIRVNPKKYFIPY